MNSAKQSKPPPAREGDDAQDETQKPTEFERFRTLTNKLLRVPKGELDEERRQHGSEAKPKP